MAIFCHGATVAPPWSSRRAPPLRRRTLLLIRICYVLKDERTNNLTYIYRLPYILRSFVRTDGRTDEHCDVHIQVPLHTKKFCPNRRTMRRIYTGPLTVYEVLSIQMDERTNNATYIYRFPYIFRDFVQTDGGTDGQCDVIYRFSYVLRNFVRTDGRTDKQCEVLSQVHWLKINLNFKRIDQFIQYWIVKIKVLKPPPHS